MDPVSPSTKNPLLAIRLKELEVELCRQQYQNQLLHVRAVELETQRDIRLRAGAGTKDSTGSAFTFSRVTGKFSSADSSTGLFSSPCSVVRITGEGVTRHVLSTAVLKLTKGFMIPIGGAPVGTRLHVGWTPGSPENHQFHRPGLLVEDAEEGFTNPN
ncbi:hypothetical protein ROHU_032364 [Labeo rohita]|uniref:Uncharacterized protein n=1 Tax=Labeo rohita TaxID=84645 RepID=A0A498LL65_LABRO|nr:hypothetical protein ROHU_032364 [Labeo rohita]